MTRCSAAAANPSAAGRPLVSWSINCLAKWLFECMGDWSNQRRAMPTVIRTSPRSWHKREATETPEMDWRE
ncbi:unnamed protein product [Protopolystoma xenopodis]|uniref:Uncharacterized protein n=1 Tax=Protopolystoma xenopodis TaxID=117903 RepID=A0A3S5C8Q1_9PLAT|nr:unnamed protein product [Protopolystoma xenopodis]